MECKLHITTVMQQWSLTMECKATYNHCDATMEPHSTKVNNHCNATIEPHYGVQSYI